MDLLLDIFMWGFIALLVLVGLWGLTCPGTEAKLKRDKSFQASIKHGLKTGSVRRMKDL